MADDKEVVNTSIKLMRNPVRKSIKGKKRATTLTELHETQSAYSQFPQPTEEQREKDVGIDKNMSKVSSVKKVTSVEDVNIATGLNSPVSCKKRSHSEQQMKNHPHPFFRNVQSNEPAVHEIGNKERQKEKDVAKTLASTPKKLTFRESNQKYLLAALNKQSSDSALKERITFLRGVDVDPPRNDISPTPKKRETTQVLNRNITTSMSPPATLEMYHSLLPQNVPPMKKAPDSIKQDEKTFFDKVTYCSDPDSLPNNRMPPKKTLVPNKYLIVDMPRNKAVYSSDPDSLPNNTIPPKKPSSRSRSVDRGICADAIWNDNLLRASATEHVVTTEQFKSKEVYSSDPDSLPNNNISPRQPSSRSRSVDRGICADAIWNDNLLRTSATEHVVTTEQFKSKEVYSSDPDSLPNNNISPRQPSSRSRSVDRGICADAIWNDNLLRTSATEHVVTTEQFKSKEVYSSDPDSLPNNYIPPRQLSSRSRSVDRGICADGVCKDYLLGSRATAGTESLPNNYIPPRQPSSTSQSVDRGICADAVCKDNVLRATAGTESLPNNYIPPRQPSSTSQSMDRGICADAVCKDNVLRATAGTESLPNNYIPPRQPSSTSQSMDRGICADAVCKDNIIRKRDTVITTTEQFKNKAVYCSDPDSLPNNYIPSTKPSSRSRSVDRGICADAVCKDNVLRNRVTADLESLPKNYIPPRKPLRSHSVDRGVYADAICKDNLSRKRATVATTATEQFKKKAVYCSDPDSLPNNYIPPKKSLSDNAAKESTIKFERLTNKVKQYREPDRLPTNSIPKKSSTSSKQAEENTNVNIIEPLSNLENGKMTMSSRKVDKSRLSDPQSLPRNCMPRQQSSVPKIDKPEKHLHYEESPKNEMPKRAARTVMHPIARAAQSPTIGFEKKIFVLPTKAMLTKKNEKTKRSIDADLAQLKMEVPRHSKQPPVNRQQELINNMTENMTKKLKPARKDLPTQTERTSKDVTAKAGHNKDASEHIVKAPHKLNKEPLPHSRLTMDTRKKKQLTKPTRLSSQSQVPNKVEPELRQVQSNSISKAQTVEVKAAEPSHLEERSNTVSKAETIAAQPSPLEERSNTVSKAEAIAAQPSHQEERSNTASKAEAIAAQTSHQEERSNAVRKEQAIEIQPAEPSKHEEQSNADSQDNAIKMKVAQVLMDVKEHSYATKRDQEALLRRFAPKPIKASVASSPEVIPKQRQETPSKQKQETLKYESPKSFKKLTEQEQKLKSKATKDPQSSSAKLSPHEAMQLRREATRVHTQSQERKVARKRSVESYSKDAKSRVLDKSLTRIRKLPQSHQKPKNEAQTTLKKVPVIKERVQNRSASLVHPDKHAVLKQVGQKHEIPTSVKRELDVDKQQHKTSHTTVTISPQEPLQATAKPPTPNMSTEPHEKTNLQGDPLQRQVEGVCLESNKNTSTKGTTTPTAVKSTNELREQREPELVKLFDDGLQNVLAEQLKKYSRKAVSLKSTKELLEQQAKQFVGQHTESASQTALLTRTNVLHEQKESTKTDHEVPKQFVRQPTESAKEAALLTTKNLFLHPQPATKPSDHEVPKQFVSQPTESTRGTASSKTQNVLLEQQEPTKTINNAMPKQLVGPHKKGTYTQTNKEKRNIDISREQTIAKKLLQRRASRDRFMQNTPDKTTSRPFVRKTKSRQKLARSPATKPQSMGDVIVEKKMGPPKNALEAQDKEVSQQQLVRQDEARRQEQVQSIVNEYDRSTPRIIRYPTVLHQLRKNISEQALQTMGQQSPPQAAVPPTTTQVIPSSSNVLGGGTLEEDYLNYHPNLQRFIPDSVAQKPLRERLARPTPVTITQHRLSKPRTLVKPPNTVVKPRNTASGTVRTNVGGNEQIKADRSRPYVYEQMKVATAKTTRRQVEPENHNRCEKPVLYQQQKTETAKNAVHNTGLGWYPTPLQQQSMHDWSKSDKIDKSKKTNSAAQDAKVSSESVVKPKPGEIGTPAGKEKLSKEAAVNTSTVVTKNIEPTKSEQRDTPNYFHLPPGPLIANVLQPRDATRETNVANTATKESTATVKADTKGSPGDKPLAVVKPKTPFRLENDGEFELKSREINHPTIKPHPSEMWINEMDSGNITERTVNITAGQTNPRLMHLQPLQGDSEPRSDILGTRKSNVELSSSPKLSDPAREAQVGVKTDDKPAEKPLLASDKTPAAVETSTTTNKTSSAAKTTLGSKDTTMVGANKTPAAFGTPIMTNQYFPATNSSGLKCTFLLGADKTPAAVETSTMTNKISSAVNTTLGSKDTTMVGANKTPAALETSTMTNKISSAANTTLGSKDTTMVGANKTPAALETTTTDTNKIYTAAPVKTSAEAVKTVVTPDKTQSAVNTTSSAANRTPTVPVANTGTTVTVNQPPGATKPKKPFRLDDDEFDLELDEPNLHPTIKPPADPLWLQKANLSELSEDTVNRPEGQNHPRSINVQVPPHLQMKPLRDNAWLKSDDLGNISEKTVGITGTTKHVRIINETHSLKDNRPRQHSNTSQVPQTQQKEASKELAGFTQDQKPTGWQPAILQKAVAEASKGLLHENKRNKVEEVEQPNIEDLILAKLNSKPEQAPTKPNEPPKVRDAPQLATSGGATQQHNLPSKLQIAKPTETEPSHHMPIPQYEPDKLMKGSFKSQINRKRLKRLIDMEFERISKENKGSSTKPGEKSSIEFYHTPADIPELPDVDSLIRKSHSTRLPSQTPTPQLNIKMLREEINELKQIHKTKEKPAAMAWQPQNTTEAKKVEIPQQLIDKIPVQGKAESGMMENCEKPNNPMKTKMENKAHVSTVRLQDEKISEQMKITTLKPTVAKAKTNTRISSQGLQETLEEVASTILKKAQSHGQTAKKSLQNEIKTYVKDLYKTGYFQPGTTKKPADKQSAQTQAIARPAAKPQQRPSTVNDDNRKKLATQVQSSYKQSEAVKARYNQIKYPLRLRTHSGGPGNERVKATMQSDGRPSTSSGETASASGAAKGPEEVPPPPAGGGSGSNKSAPPSSNSNRPPPPPEPPKEGYFPPCPNCDKTAGNAEGGAGGTGATATEGVRSSGEAPLTGLSKHFNSSTIRGRANVAKATFALLGLYTVYRMLRKEPREY